MHSTSCMLEESYIQQLTQLYQQAPRTTAQPLILDARPASKYLHRRLAAAVNIPLLGLTARCYLLPDKTCPFAVVLPATSDYVVITEASQHGSAQPGGSQAVYLKGAASLQDFLTSRGWSLTKVLQDIPDMWAAAEQLTVLEQGPVHQQQRRCLFAPSELLSASIDQIEAALIQQQCMQQQHMPEAQQQQVVLHALDVGCGSGRDLAWLASRRPKLTGADDSRHGNPGSSRLAECSPGVDAHHGKQQQQLAQDAQLHQEQPPQQQLQQVDCVPAQWHVTGIDEWLGALERAADLAEAMELAAKQVHLVFSKICPDSGQLQLLRLPAKSSLNRRRLAVNCTAASGEAAAEPDNIANVTTQKYHLILCCRVLVRAFLPCLREMLLPRGFIVYCTFLDMPGVRAFGRPAGPEHLLQPGELSGQHFGPDQGFTVCRDDVVTGSDGREVCWFVARKDC